MSNFSNTAAEKTRLEAWYNTDRFPTKIGQNGPWGIYRNADGYCAAIPNEGTTGHLPTHFGDMEHVAGCVKAGSVTLI